MILYFPVLGQELLFQDHKDVGQTNGLPARNSPWRSWLRGCTGAGGANKCSWVINGIGYIKFREKTLMKAILIQKVRKKEKQPHGFFALIRVIIANMKMDRLPDNLALLALLSWPICAYLCLLPFKWSAPTILTPGKGRRMLSYGISGQYDYRIAGHNCLLSLEAAREKVISREPSVLPK